MSPITQEILARALDLDEDERSSIAAALIESLGHGSEDPDVEEAWDREIERRVAELEAGTVETIPWSEVRGQLFSGFE